MDFLIAICYLLAYPVISVASILLLLLLHEAGHALVALALVSGKVNVFIGPSEYPAGTWQVRLGRLEFWASRNLLDWRRGGYCQFAPTATTWRQVLIVLAGPALPLAIASGGFYMSMHVENGVHRLVTLLFLFVALVSTLQNIFSRRASLRGDDGQLLLTDGQLLRQLVFPSPLERQAAQALRHFATGHYAESAMLYRQLLATPAPTAHFFQQLIYCCIYLRYNEEGLQVDARFQQERPANYTDADRSNGAVLLIHTHQLVPALAIYTSLLNQDPPYLGAYNNRGYTYSEMGEHRLAIADFDCAIASGIYVAEAYCNRAYCWLKLGEPAAALRDLRHSLQLAPAAAATHANLGHYYFAQEAYEQALSFFEQASRLGPPTPELTACIQKTRQRLEATSGTGEQLISTLSNPTLTPAFP
jgi:tetratricopeptide (TPR) repeat protein